MTEPADAAARRPGAAETEPGVTRITLGKPYVRQVVVGVGAVFVLDDGTVGTGITVNDVGGTIISSTPGLGLLADNGGPTQTMALQPGSAAIDTGPTTVPTFAGNEFDQRGAGFLRVVNGRVDIGAYEVQAEPIVVRFTG